MDKTDQYQAQVEAIKERYADRIMAILYAAKHALEEDGFSCSNPFDMSADDYRWSLVVYPTDSLDDETTSTDITIQIAESVDYDGSEDGINFVVDVVTYGGRMLGGLTPYNYTDQCWVSLDDPDAIEERFQLIERADVAELAALVKGG